MVIVVLQLLALPTDQVCVIGRWFGMQAFLYFFWPGQVPLTPRLTTIPLPSVEGMSPGGNVSNQPVQWTDTSEQAVKVSNSLAVAKPINVEDKVQPKVSDIVHLAEDYALK